MGRLTANNVPGSTALSPKKDFGPETFTNSYRHANAVYLSKDRNSALVRLYTPDGPNLPFPPYSGDTLHRCGFIVLDFTISANG